ncbi:hypothetical protein F5X71_22365 [Nocardia brasiliensis]|uniref:ABC transmembrane type-1 domain-containing protein n=1 Tax=Nocardia brasiliensis TaxID=37326 RepID=A0A6G9XUV4_NOCBR|nr:hypothetical protein [Nocardia brasiliensis]QIS04704.1 hypothetical protein F5X71_22365 [Nocardia brasiliensis]
MTGRQDYQAHGLLLELATRRMRGPLVPGSHPRRWTGVAAALPATVLTVSLVVAPVVWTVVSAARARPLLVGSCLLAALGGVGLTLLARQRRAVGARPVIRGRRWLARRRVPLPRWLIRVVPRAVALVLLAAALALVGGGSWLLGTALGRDGGLAYLRTLGWLLVGVLMLAAALCVAWWARDSQWLWRPLIVSFGISAVVSGVAFRLIFEYLGDLLGIDSVVGYRIWYALMLCSAFVWTWFGFVTGLFRAGIRAIETDSVRSGFLHHGPGRFPLRLFGLLRPVVLIVGLAVGVAAARVFDVVLIGVPGSMQYELDSATVHWWRMAVDTATDPGEAAAYGLPLAVLVGFLAWLLQTDIRRHRTSWSGRAAVTGAVARSPRKPLRLLGIVAVSVLALVPIGWLVHACLRDRDGYGTGALTRVWRDPALPRALETTVWVAGLATLVVVAAAVPVAYRLAALRPNRPAATGAVVALVVLSVLPVQSYLGPVDAFIDAYGLSGTRIPLILLHAAAGLPIAILVLRGALLAPPGSPAADALHGLAGPGTIARRVLVSAGPALGAVAALEFIQVWNDFVIGLLISGAGATPWSLLLWGEARQFGENSAQLAAGALISAVLPVALLLVTWRRWLVPGLTGGALR